MSTNVAQSYPYRLEREEDRIGAIKRTLAAHEGLADRLREASLPYDGAVGSSAWSWRCRTAGCAGVLHTAGYARERRGLVALCDGCAAIVLR
jgi:hypothetical protein